MIGYGFDNKMENGDPLAQIRSGNVTYGSVCGEQTRFGIALPLAGGLRFAGLAVR